MLRSAIAKTAIRTATPRTGGPSTVLQPVFCRAYHEKVISHYENPRNVRHFRMYPTIQ